jgi:hypothetical protein
VQVVLATAHWLRFGYGSEGNELHGITNRERVNNNRACIGTAVGRQRYVTRVLEPIAHAIGRHRALFGWLILNEGYSMVDKEDSVRTMRDASHTRTHAHTHTARARTDVHVHVHAHVYTCTYTSRFTHTRSVAR